MDEVPLKPDEIFALAMLAAVSKNKDDFVWLVRRVGRVAARLNEEQVKDTFVAYDLQECEHALCCYISGYREESADDEEQKDRFLDGVAGIIVGYASSLGASTALLGKAPIDSLIMANESLGIDEIVSQSTTGLAAALLPAAKKLGIDLTLLEDAVDMASVSTDQELRVRLTKRLLDTFDTSKF